MSATSVPRPRLSARRGSNTAPDPFGVHADVNLNPNRSTSSRLTIVRVPSTPAATPSPTDLQRRHSRRGTPGAQSPPPDAGPPGRISFAFSPFGGPGPRASSPVAGAPASPTSSPRLRPSSPHLSASNFGGKPRLTPDQLVDLARQATHLSQGTTPAPSPGLGNHSPVFRTHALPAEQPATFTPLPDDIYLPFIERPSEVSTLISSPPDAKLFALLAQTFPRTSVESHSPTMDLPVELPRDPTQWSYNQLVYHLTRIDRNIAPDFIWAIAARKCILSHSELLWERIKGALGVPPELDVEYDFLQDDQESPDTSDISDDEGRAARGHWSDWDAVMDSPIYARSKHLTGDLPDSAKAVTDEEAAAFRDKIENKLLGLHDGTAAEDKNLDPDAGGGDSTIAPTPQGKGTQSPPNEELPSILYDAASPTCDPTSPDYISIEPLIAAPPQAAVVTPGGQSGDGLGDIAEGAEEEEEDGEGQDANVNEEPDLISPSQIQGLRISTVPLTTSTSLTPAILSPVSPLPPFSGDTQQGTGPLHHPIPASGSSHSSGYAGSRPHSRASSFSSIGPFQRSESAANLSGSWSSAALAALSNASGSGSQYAGSVIGSDAGDSSGYISDGERLPGNPLFVSNFARLNAGPNIKANNPATRPPQHVPHTRYNSAAPFRGPSLANRPGKVRAYSHGSSTVGVRPAMAAGRQSFESTENTTATP